MKDTFINILLVFLIALIVPASIIIGCSFHIYACFSLPNINLTFLYFVVSWSKYMHPLIGVMSYGVVAAIVCAIYQYRYFNNVLR